MSVVRVLRRLGVAVGFPGGQTCCGQAVYNSGYRREAREMAVRTLDEFRESEYVVVPSGSCSAMIKHFYLDLLEDDPALLARAERLSRKVYEFSEFLVEVLGPSTGSGEEPLGGRPHAAPPSIPPRRGGEGGNPPARPEPRLRLPYRRGGEGEKVVFHPGCHLLREMEVRDAPQSLLRAVAGLEVREMRNAESCCGFGGAFSVKMPHISEGMLRDKVSAVRDALGSCTDGEAQGEEAGVLVSCDMSCLMHIGGALRREAPEIEIRHLAQVLDTPRTGFGEMRG